MSEETEMTPITPVDGMVPPKVAPFGAAPQEESVPAAAPAEAPAAEAPAASGPKTIKLRPVIRKPVIRKPPAPGAAAAPKLPETPAPAPAAPAPAAPEAPVAEAPAAPNPKSITGAIPAPAVLKKTGIIAEGILTPSQAQAAKTKTSRISLESAMGVPPPSVSSGPLKTIKLRRPTGIKAPARPASPIASPIKPASDDVSPLAPVENIDKAAQEETPAAVAPIAPETIPEAEDTSEKKTVKLRRPASAIKRPTITPSPVAEGDNLDEIKDIPELSPISDLSSAAPQKSSPLAVITLVASIAAIAILGVVTYQLFSQSVGPVTGPNEFAFIEG